MTEELLSTLHKQRASAKGNITRIKKFLEDRRETLNTIDLECRLEILNSYIKQLMAYQTEIEKISPDDRRAELEEICITTKTLLLTQMGSCRPSMSHDTTFSAPLPPANRLPHLKIPKFTGKYSEYRNFIACFNNLVHDDPTLTKIEKFNHLIASLQDDALRTVKAFQVNENNYESALARLAERYDNKCLIFQDHIASLFNLKKIVRPNAPELRQIIDTVSAVLDSLSHLGSEKDIMNAIVIHLVLSKVDADTKAKWDENLDYRKLPQWKDCASILIRRCQFLEVNEEKAFKGENGQNRFGREKLNGKGKKPQFALACTQVHTNECYFCSGMDHLIGSCPMFLAFKVSQRFDYIKRKGLCINCLKYGHSVRKCRATRCAICRRPHNAILHNEELIPEMSSAHNGYGSEAQTSGAATNNGTAKRSHEQVPSNRTAVQSHDPQQRLPYGNSATTMLAYESKGEVILATALVQMKDKCGQYHVARCLLDSGSQINIVTEDLVHRLKLERHSSTLSVQGVGDGNKRVRHRVSTYMKSCVNEFEIETDFYVMKTITCPQPRNHISVDNLGIPSNIELADPQFNKPQRIDILVGAQIFFDLLCIGQIKLGTELPILQKTLLGWIVSGRYGIERKVMALSFCVSTTSEENLLQELSERVQRFWELEWVPNCSTMTSEHLMCEKHFLNTATRSDGGRFEVRLPFKTDPKVLGHSYETAKRRFLALERRLSKNVEMKRMYTDFMKEYLLLGHMSQTNTEDMSLPHYFIPHQCVIRAQSTSTKLRVVFDASCKTSSQKSLNDILMVGPTIQNDLFTTLSKFRVNKYALTADITKMYRQVNVHKDDRKFQLILWRENCDMPIQTYELNTVTYGTGPAPFLAIRCLKEISHLFKEVYPLGSKIIATDFYVDDLLSGANDIDTLMQIRSEVIQILNACGFSLAKWHSNVKGFGSDESVMQLDVHDATFTRALGVNWKPQDDVIFFHLDNDFSNLPATKRNILSVSSRLFDPLGLLSPIIIKAKILLQQLWTNNLDWDESIPQHLDTEWSYFKTVLTQINQICIPRFIGTTLNASVQIHGFADASMKAFGCCIYVVSRQGNDVTTRLFLAKSRVAPSKKIKTLPKLELCAAHLLAKLWSVANVNLSPFKIDDIFFWSDSEIVLHWVKTHPSMLSTFVGNRVAQISEYCEEAKWRYVPSAQNPADIVSRGCDVTELQNSDWLSGPDFLRHSIEKWPVNRFELSPSDLKLEMKKSQTTLVSSGLKFENSILRLVESTSSHRKLLRIIGYILRFIRCCRSKCKVDNVHLSVGELNTAFLKIVQILQSLEFNDEINKLDKSGLNNRSNIQKLNPFIQRYSTNGLCLSLLRVGGRLKNASLPYEEKFPLLLTRESHFVQEFFRHLHISNCHAGPKVLIGLSREKIWVINARHLARKTVRNCVTCFRFKPILNTQIMGDLPNDRLTSCRPFWVCGVDLCGPILTTLRLRGRPPVKTYVAVFVCFASKAVHLEALSDLQTDTFLCILNRFVGRRGIPKTIWCDNATNFVGTARLWSHKDQLQVQQKTAEKGIEFRFIPPRAPHFGGLWEAAVKSAKHLLLRTMGNAGVTYEELTTLLVDVEAVLNSRPIVAITEDPNDEVALTPGHLLIGCALKSLPTTEEYNNKASSLKRFRILSSLKEHFWDAWRRDYIRELQTRVKWTSPTDNVKIEGDVVLIHEDNLPPQKWLTGKVVDVELSSDNKVRVAEVKTKDGTYKRAIHKLAKLPFECSKVELQSCNGAGVSAVNKPMKSL